MTKAAIVILSIWLAVATIGACFLQAKVKSFAAQAFKEEPIQCK